jgi:hypothetical protein
MDLENVDSYRPRLSQPTYLPGRYGFDPSFDPEGFEVSTTTEAVNSRLPDEHRRSILHGRPAENPTTDIAFGDRLLTTGTLADNTFSKGQLDAPKDVSILKKHVVELQETFDEQDGLEQEDLEWNPTEQQDKFTEDLAQQLENYKQDLAKQQVIHSKDLAKQLKSFMKDLAKQQKGSAGKSSKQPEEQTGESMSHRVELSRMRAEMRANLSEYDKLSRKVDALPSLNEIERLIRRRLETSNSLLTPRLASKRPLDAVRVQFDLPDDGMEQRGSKRVQLQESSSRNLSSFSQFQGIKPPSGPSASSGTIAPSFRALKIFGKPINGYLHDKELPLPLSVLETALEQIIMFGHCISASPQVHKTWSQDACILQRNIEEECDWNNKDHDVACIDCTQQGAVCIRETDTEFRVCGRAPVEGQVLGPDKAAFWMGVID